MAKNLKGKLVVRCHHIEMLLAQNNSGLTYPEGCHQNTELSQSMPEVQV
jgi:hypothetical protein